jgi:ATP-binding cassette subfamily B protein
MEKQHALRESSNLKRFATYYKPHMGLFILDMVCALLIAGIDLAFPMLTRQAINGFLPSIDNGTGEFRPYLVFIIALVGLYVIRTGLQFIVDFYGHMLGIRMEYDMRKELFGHLQKLSFKFYDKTRTGHIMSRMMNDLNEMTELAHHGPEDLFLSTIMLAGSFVLLLFIEWRLALSVYIFVPLLIWFAIKRRGKMSASFKEVKQKIAGVNADLESSISGIRVSKAFANEDYEIEKFDSGNLVFRSSKDEAYRNMAVFMSGMSFMTNILNVIVLGVGGFFIYRGEMGYGDLTAFILYVNNFLVPVRRLTQFVQQYEAGMTGFERFLEIIDEEPDIKDRKNAVTLKNVEGVIEFDQVSFGYDGDEKVLDHISIKIPVGKTLALVGPSGGGKTTLCHLIPRFYEVTGGSIRLDGTDIRDIKMSDLRGHIGLVSQDVFLFAGTIRENIQYGRRDAREGDIIEAAKNAQIHEFIMSLPEGYDTNIGERGIRLSGGQKQRISIARVFLKDPAILILDEATSALDNETETLIQQALEKLSKGRTSLVIAHRLSTIKHAHEIVVINEEGIAEQGRHEVLLEKGGIYASLYKAQFKGYIPDKPFLFADKERN